MVVECVYGLRDNQPGELNSFNFIGNYVMLKHGDGLYSILGHLRQNCISVKEGAKIAGGQKIGECGNSGYSTDPHLHFHIQDSDVFAKMDKDYKRIDVAQGLKINFQKVILRKGDDKRLFTDYSPTKGDMVSN